MLVAERSTSTQHSRPLHSSQQTNTRHIGRKHIQYHEYTYNRMMKLKTRDEYKTDSEPRGGDADTLHRAFAAAVPSLSARQVASSKLLTHLPIQAVTKTSRQCTYRKGRTSMTIQVTNENNVPYTASYAQEHEMRTHKHTTQYYACKP